MGIRSVLISGVIAATAVFGAGPASSQASAPSSKLGAGALTAPAPAPDTRSAGRGTSVVTLLSGDRVRVGRTTGDAVVVAPRGRLSGGGARKLVLGGHTYLFPRSLDGVIGRTLDPELFDVAALAARGGRTPVTVTYRPGASATAVPGVQQTRRDGDSASGVITPDSAAAFGRALGSSSAATLFAGVERISVDVPTAADDVAARWPMHTVTITGTDAQGEPLNDFVVALAVDDATKSGQVVLLDRGRAKVSLPEGTYVLMAAQFDAAGRPRVAMTRDFVVNRPRDAAIDLRTATTPVTVGVPKPVDFVASALDIARTVTTNGETSGSSYGFATDGRIRVLVTPTPRPAIGTISARASILAHAKSGPNDGRYALVHTRTGTIPRSAVTVVSPTERLARIDSVFFVPRRGLPSLLDRWIEARGDGGWSFGRPVPTPGRVTEYVTGGTEMVTKAFFNSSVDPATGEPVGLVESEWREVPAGNRITEEWLKGPFGTGFFDDPRVFAGATPLCGACVSGNTLVLAAMQMDTFPWHILYADRPGGRPAVTWAVQADGRTIRSGEDYLITTARLPNGTRTIGATVTAKRPAPFTTSTTITSTWSQPLASAYPIHPGWTCEAGPACRMIPLAFVKYDLPIGFTGHLAPGRRELDLTVNQFGRNAPRGLSGVHLDIDYGAGWRRVPLRSNGSGRFTATLDVPAAAAGRTAADFRVTVTGADGSRFTETNARAFLLTR